eukprot:m.145545 g.145545  ORF g.145545 m.145545 type:complete len:199 (+) comp17225_c0_seq6:136-732(+)
MVASPVVMVAACVALLLPFATLVGGDDNINVARSSRSFAYATALSASLSWHGFDDGEQLLALRVLLQSLQPIAPRQFFVFVDRTVSTATQNILTSAGATVVKVLSLACCAVVVRTRQAFWHQPRASKTTGLSESHQSTRHPNSCETHDLASSGGVVASNVTDTCVCLFVCLYVWGGGACVCVFACVCVCVNCFVGFCS